MLNKKICNKIQLHTIMSIKKDKFGVFLKLKHFSLYSVSFQSSHGLLVKDSLIKIVRRSYFSIKPYQDWYILKNFKMRPIILETIWKIIKSGFLKVLLTWSIDTWNQYIPIYKTEKKQYVWIGATDAQTIRKIQKMDMNH